MSMYVLLTNFYNFFYFLTLKGSTYTMFRQRMFENVLLKSQNSLFFSSFALLVENIETFSRITFIINFLSPCALRCKLV